MMDFYGFGILAFISALIYLAVIITIIWLIFRFVSAQESMADSLRLIAYELRDRADRDFP